jgi:hypothetical protein
MASQPRRAPIVPVAEAWPQRISVSFYSPSRKLLVYSPLCRARWRSAYGRLPAISNVQQFLEHIGLENVGARTSQEKNMHKALLMLATAGLLVSAGPALAQDVGVSIRGSGVSVGVGTDRPREYRRYEGRRAYLSSDRRAGCSDVTVKKRMPNGSVVIKKTQRCY